jgi:hypothetical protein
MEYFGYHLCPRRKIGLNSVFDVFSLAIRNYQNSNGFPPQTPSRSQSSGVTQSKIP